MSVLDRDNRDNFANFPALVSPYNVLYRTVVSLVRLLFEEDEFTVIVNDELYTEMRNIFLR